MRNFCIALVAIFAIGICQTSNAQSFCTSGSCGVGVSVQSGFSSFVQPSITVSSSPVFFEPQIVTVPSVVQSAPVVVQQQHPQIIVNRRNGCGSGFSSSGINVNVNSNARRFIRVRRGLFGSTVIRSF